MENQNKSKRIWFRVTGVILVAVGLGSLLFWSGILPISVEKQDGCLQITIGTPKEKTLPPPAGEQTIMPAEVLAEAEDQSLELLDMTVISIPEEARRYFSLPQGVYICRSQREDMFPRDIITEVGGHAVAHPEELRKALELAKAHKSVSVAVFRQGKTVNLDISLEDAARP